jgi:ATP-dependent helicase HrpB
MAERLPIYDIEEQLVTGLPQTRRLIVSAPTGSGKSTQVPQMLLDRGLLGTEQGSVQQNVMFSPDAVRPCERAGY